MGAPSEEAETIAAYLEQAHSITTAHELKDAAPEDCASSEDCPAALRELMSSDGSFSSAEVVQNGLRFLQKEYDEEGFTRPGAAPAEEEQPAAAEAAQEDEEAEEGTVELEEAAEEEDPEAAEARRLDDGVDAVVRQLVALHTKTGKLEAMKGEPGIRKRLSQYWAGPDDPERLSKAEAFATLVKRRFKAFLDEGEL